MSRKPANDARSLWMLPATPAGAPAAATGRILRDRVLDFAELCKPRLSLLVLLTVAAGFWAASLSGVALMPQSAAFFGALGGVALTAAGGAAWNQVLERRLDARMYRTKDRPLAAGRVAPEIAALCGTLAGIAGLVVLDTFVHRLAAVLALVSLVNYVVIYTPLKRVTTFNTLVGAVTGALPPMIGWVAATGELDQGAWALFAILFVWQIPHFLAIAWLYREDYARAGMRMLGVDPREQRLAMREIVLFSLTMVPVSLMPALAGFAGGLYVVVAALLGAAFVALSVAMARRRTREAARRLFVASIVYLPALLGVLLADCALRDALRSSPPAAAYGTVLGGVTR